MGKGGFAAQSFGIVAGGDEERRRDVGPDAQRGDELGRGLFDQGLEDGVDSVISSSRVDGPAGQPPQA